MARNRTLKELSEALLSSKKVPLEDRVFASLLCLAMVIALLGLGCLQAVEINGISSARQALAKLYVEHWAFQKQPKANSIDFNDIDSAVTKTHFGLVNLSALPFNLKQTDSNFAIFESPEGQKFAVLRHERALGQTQALIVPHSELASISGNTEEVSFKRGVIVVLMLVAFLIGNRIVLRSLIFKKMDVLTRTIFSRMVYFATGGIAFDKYGGQLDGRLHIFKTFFRQFVHFVQKSTQHKSKHVPQDAEPQPPLLRTHKKHEIQIERLPQAPQIPVDGFSNDEMRQIAVSLDEGFQKQQRNEKSVCDVFEAVSKPIIALLRDGSIFHANKGYLDLHHCARAGLSRQEYSSIDALLLGQLGLDKELVRRINLIFDQKAPRLVAKEVQVTTLDGSSQKLFLSVSILNFHGRRLIVLQFDDFKTETINTNAEEMIFDVALLQLRTLQKISLMVQRDKKSDNTPVFAEMETLIDQINSLFDITSLNSRRYLVQNVEFNLVTFFRDLPERIGTGRPVELFIPRDVPTFVLGDPSNLRQCIKSIAEAFFEANPTTALKILVGNTNSREILVSFESTNRSPVMRHAKAAGFLQKFLPFFIFKIHDLATAQPHIYQMFSFPLALGKGEMSLLKVDEADKLHNKKVIFLYSGEALDPETQSLYFALQAKKKELVRLKDFSPSQLAISDANTLVVFTEGLAWHCDESLHSLVKSASKLQISSLVIPCTPKRGDSRHATECGFTAYLSRPFGIEDFLGLLTLISHSSMRQNQGRLSLLTRHSVRDLMQNVGKVLVAHFHDDDGEPSEALNANLCRLGFKVSRAQTANCFFELLYRTDFDFVFVPDDMSSGLRRRMALSLRGRTLLTYGKPARGGAAPIESENQIASSRIRNPEDPAEITRSMHEATEKKRKAERVESPSPTKVRLDIVA